MCENLASKFIIIIFQQNPNIGLYTSYNHIMAMSSTGVGPSLARLRLSLVRLRLSLVRLGLVLVVALSSPNIILAIRIS